MSIFLLKTLRTFLKNKTICHEDGKDHNLHNKLLGLQDYCKSKEYLFKSPTVQLLLFVMIQRERLIQSPSRTTELGNVFIFQFKWYSL